MHRPEAADSFSRVYMLQSDPLFHAVHARRSLRKRGADERLTPTAINYNKSDPPISPITYSQMTPNIS